MEEDEFLQEETFYSTERNTNAQHKCTTQMLNTNALTQVLNT